ncbi:Ohr family peroxiredoxin [Planococcus sp. YIM B11945]|uniref:Ohr family peroxiredoxin n=1 Tax=Planococcus sp. YIM B11945 TaxID=3435410 RepID=UPI003D7ED22A
MAGSGFIFQTTAKNVGGPGGVSFLADGSFSARVAHPIEMGGEGDGNNPGQFLALGYSTSFNFTLARILKEQGITGEPIVASTIELHPDPSDNGFKLAVKIELAIQGLEKEEVQLLADKAHLLCPYSKAMKNNIEVTLTAVSYVAMA